MKIKDIEIMPEKKQYAQLTKLEKKRDFTQYGRDGHIEIGRKQYSYKGITYEIAVLRYYHLRPNGFHVMMNDRITDCHAVLEFPDTMQKVVDMIKAVDAYSEFLYYDTLHSYNDKQTIEQQVDECHERARLDIDGIPELIDRAEDKVKSLNESITSLKNMFSSGIMVTTAGKQLSGMSMSSTALGEIGRHFKL